MSDLVVKLYDLPPIPPPADEYAIVRAMSPNRNHIISWTKIHFGDLWASEVAIAFSRTPVTCFLALENDRIVGFSCYETTYKTFFGPTGVLPEHQGKGLGKALLLHALHGLHSLGYPYGIIGDPGPVDFYVKAVGGIVIPDNNRGAYRDMLNEVERG